MEDSMFKDERSEEAKRRDAAKAAADKEVEEKERRIFEAQKQRAVEQAWPNGAGWLPIESMPFDAYGKCWTGGGQFFVTDGASVALATLHERFGRPLYWTGKEPPEMVHVQTDAGMAIRFEGDGEYKEPDWPDWLFKWEFLSATETRLSYGDTVPDEIDFVPTKWMPLPPPPQTGE